MKLFFLLVIGALSGCATKSSDESSSATFQDLLPNTKIVYSANVDGEIEPCGCRSTPTGGIDRRYNLVQQLLQGEKLSIDSGDLLYKSTPVAPFLEPQWTYQARALIDAYNKLGVEVFTPGELDFAAGFETFRKLIQKAKFKTVVANLYLEKNKQLAFDPYIILEKSNRKVAIFGLYGDEIGAPEELTVRDSVATAREMVKLLKGKADIVIALTHQGLEKDEALAKAVSGIDAIFGAHSQSFLHIPTKIGDTLIFQPSFRGQHLGVFEHGQNGLYQVDGRFDSKPDTETEMDVLVKSTKANIARINKESEMELFAEPTSKNKKKLERNALQTFPKCAQCHTAQFDFHRTTPHMRAFETLVNAKQSANKECLKCHTVGAPNREPVFGGWTHVTKLVFNNKDQAVDADAFARTLPKLSRDELTSKTSKAYINVQCESCHGAMGEHPFAAAKPPKISTTTCLQCHTLDRAPNWYKNGKLDAQILDAKLKSMTCPASKKD